MLLKPSLPDIEETTLAEWLALMRSTWHQGEHVCIIGNTGSGKTTVSLYLLDIRGYVVVLAVKRNDETLEKFKEAEKYGCQRYKIIEKWPPKYPDVRVILWIKPKELGELNEQYDKLKKALDAAYLAGGWTVFYDDAGYITGYLRLHMPLGIMLNQGRSDHLTIVAAMTQASSVIARLPSETFKQVRHKLIFPYENEKEIKAIAEISGIDWKLLKELMKGEMQEHDFLYKSRGKLVLVRNHQG